MKGTPDKTDLNLSFPYKEDFVRCKGIIQYSALQGKMGYLNAIREEKIERAKEYARHIDQPQIVRWLNKNKPTEEPLKIPSRFREFSPPESSDPLVNTSLTSLLHEYFDYLEFNYVAVHYSRNQYSLNILEKKISQRCFTDL